MNASSIRQRRKAAAVTAELPPQSAVRNKNRKAYAKLPKPSDRFNNRLKQPTAKNNCLQPVFVAHGDKENRAEDLGRLHRHRSEVERSDSFVNALSRTVETASICYSLASAVFVGRLNNRLTGQILLHMSRDNSKSFRHCTLISDQWRFLPKDLNASTLRKIHAQLKTQFKRLGITKANGWLIGSFDGKFEEGHIQVHLHLTGAGNKVEALNALRRLPCYHNSEGVPYPIRRTKVGDARKQVSYCFKTGWHSAAQPFQAHLKAKGHRWFRMPPDAEAAYLQMLHQTPVSDWLVMNGIRLGANGLVLT